jgi:rhodanese-related sulfurtransferase
MIPQLQASRFAEWRNQHDSPLVLDVREPWELQMASIREDGFRLLHIPMREVPGRMAELAENYGFEQPIACLCHHGMRSEQVAGYLAQNGFTGVVNLAGGIAAWSRDVDASVPQY